MEEFTRHGQNKRTAYLLAHAQKNPQKSQANLPLRFSTKISETWSLRHSGTAPRPPHQRTPGPPFPLFIGLMKSSNIKQTSQTVDARITNGGRRFPANFRAYKSVSPQSLLQQTRRASVSIKLAIFNVATSHRR